MERALSAPVSSPRRCSRVSYFTEFFFWLLVAFPIELYRILRVRQFSRVFFVVLPGFTGFHWFMASHARSLSSHY